MSERPTLTAPAAAKAAVEARAPVVPSSPQHSVKVVRDPSYLDVV